MRNASGHRSEVAVYGTDHGNQFDGVLVAYLAHHVVAIANWTSQQNPDGSAEGEFGTVQAPGQLNTSLIGRTNR